MRRKVARTAGVMALVLAMAAGWLFLSGTYGRWQDDRALDAACGGAVDPGEAKSLLGADRLKTATRYGRHGTDNSSGAPVICWLDVGDGYRKRAVVRMEWRSQAWSPHTEAKRDQNNYLALVSTPIGHGWSGMMNHWLDGDRDEGTATVVMDCRNTSGPRKGDSLTTSVVSWTDRSYETAAHRIHLARLTTGIAGRAARAWGCDALPGGEVTAVEPMVSLDPVRPERTAPLAAAKGTCAGIPATSSLPRSLGTSVARAPIEDCFLLPETSGKKAAKPVYRLSAFYGTFADDQRRLTSSKKGYTSDGPLLTSFADWAQARCPGTPATAVYAISKMPTRTAGRPHTYTRKALKAFAERSAKRHGCTDVRVH
ncbi:hypothetical protein HUT19_37050 [Streptomyces sp. NA02950]|uniref:hypothetical protein n=1 Tax=Streptomyces sp. NA02950 TaxID=2742137 RepID=UPI00159219FB|nr:hypothetical protein [Streptomyces sp. NA02950]QKV96619.1 hypothetical protein HUT19_37050 [Streptomyces sp. NA02950]